MTKDGLYSAVRALPKIELHRHLEGAVRLQTLVDIAHDAGIEMPEYDTETLRPFVQMMPGETRDHLHFLSKFHTLRQFFRSPEIIRRVAREVVADAAADNVKYMELRFTPRALSNILNCSYEDVITWVCQTATTEATAHNVQVRFIVSMNRHESVEIGEQVLNAALGLRELGVVAIDLAGNENGFPAQPFRDVFDRAKAAGMGVTIHAGEWAGAESMYTAIHDLGADRIGHGVRAADDPALVELLAERQTVLEICPTSNVHSGVVSDWAEHPIQTLYKNRVRTTINTDDPLVSNITLSDEIMRALEHMSFTLDDIKTHTLTAARAAFLSPDERETLAGQFEAGFAAAEQQQR